MAGSSAGGAREPAAGGTHSLTVAGAAGNDNTGGVPTAGGTQSTTVAAGGIATISGAGTTASVTTDSAAGMAGKVGVTTMGGSTASGGFTATGGSTATSIGIAGRPQGGSAGLSSSGFGGTGFGGTGVAGNQGLGGAAGQTGLQVGGWHYQRPITIGNAESHELTGFQVAFDLDTTDATRFRPDCADIRVKTQSGVQLPHWIEPETCGTTQTVVWTRVPALPIGTTTLDLQYGNPDAVDAAEGPSTFPDFFEDFAGSAINTALWTSLGNYRWSNPTQGGGELLFAGTSQQPWPEYWQNLAYVESDSILYSTRGLVLEARARRKSSSGGTGSTFRVGLCEHPTPTTFNIFYVDGGDDVGMTRFGSGINNEPSYGQDGDTLNYRTDLAFTADYHRFTIRHSGTDASGAVDDTLITTAAFEPTNLLSVYLWTNARTEDTTIDVRYDWVLVREYAAVEPTTAVGAEVSIL